MAPIEVPAECREILVINPRALLISFTQNPAVAKWIPEPTQQGVTFEGFIHEIFDPYLLQKVGRRFQEARSQMQCFVEDKHAHFQAKMAEMATQWMEKVQRQLRQQVIPTNLLRTCLKALEEEHEKGWNIDAENDVVMAQAPPLEIVKTGYQSHIPHFAELITTPEGHAWMTKQARRAMGIEGAKNQQGLSPVALAVDVHLAR